MQTAYTWVGGYRVKRAFFLPFRRADLGGWIARVGGSDPEFGLKRDFLPKTWPARYDKRTQPAMDGTGLAVGNILQLRGNHSRGTVEERFERVVALSDTGFTTETVPDEEIASLFQSATEQTA